MPITCPCSSKKDYDVCCKPFHEGLAPKNALELMRSRYAAYALNLSDYIVTTTHPANPKYINNTFSWKRSISQFSQNTLFNQLEILDFKENKTVATVTFIAHISQNNEDATFTEKSYFEKFKGRWLYRDGQIAKEYAPNLVVQGPLKLLPLAYYGNPILRRKAAAITEMTPDILTLIEEMIATMDACDGIGLAAPQIHHSIRLFIIRKPIENDQSFEAGEVKVFINPVLSEPSEETWKAPEGCLSIPTFRSEVERSREITVEYTTPNGKKIKERVSGWEAKVILHEYDHIEGILYIDHLSQEEQAKWLPDLQNLKKRLQENEAL
jgi:peptide deformylase